jgi:quercetin dioxygenase-like cupin family protein
MRSLLIAGLLASSATIATAQGSPSQSDPHAVMVMPDQVTWGAGPASLPAGAKAAVLEGNPKEAGAFTMRLSLPDGYRIPPHSHPADERLTIIEGTFRLGMGDKFDESALKALKAGSYVSMKPGTKHFVLAKGNTVVQINGVGPWKISYVNPGDDPRKETSQR